jgi:outer membrane receptor for ferrienterochelin and colicins
MRLAVIMSLLLFGMISTEALGQEVPKVQEIVIEETEEEKALQERKEAPYAKTVITKKEMEELGGQTAADVLRRLPRLFFSGPPAVNKDIRMTGLDKEFQNVLINGNRPPGGGEKREFALDRIPVEAIERIEILKNPTAAYDSDSIAGIVNIILKEPPKTMHFSASAGLTYNDLADKAGNKLSIAYGDRKGPVGFTIGGTRHDDYRGKEKEVRDGSKNEGGTEIEVVRTITSSLNLGLTYALGKNSTLSFKPNLLDQTEQKSKEKPLFNLSTGALKKKNIENEKKEMLLQSYGLEWEHRFAGGSGLRLAALFSRNDEDKDKKTDEHNASLSLTKNIFEDERKEDKETVFAVDYKMPFSGPFDTDHIISTGAKQRNKSREVIKETFEINNFGVKKMTTNPDDSYSLKESITALYLMDQATITGDFILAPGLRVEITDGEYSTLGGKVGEGDFTDWNPSLHALVKLGKGYQARASFARTIGRPPFKDKVPTRTAKPDKIEEGNPDLKAAKSLNFEAGIEKYLGKTGLISVGAFYKDIKDVIEKQQIGIDSVSGLSVVRPVNVSEASVRGLEFETKTGLEFIGLRDLTVSANFTLLGSEVKDPVTGQERRLKEQPDSLANVIVRYDSRKLGLAGSIGVNYIGEKIDESDPTKPKKVEKPFTQWDVSIKKTLFRNASIYGSVINLFKEEKEKTEALKTEKEEVGRIFFIGLRYEL